MTGNLLCNCYDLQKNKMKIKKECREGIRDCESSVNQTNCDWKRIKSNIQGYSCKISASVFEMWIFYLTNCMTTKELDICLPVWQELWKTLPLENAEQNY